MRALNVKHPPEPPLSTGGDLNERRRSVGVDEEGAPREYTVTLTVRTFVFRAKSSDQRERVIRPVR